jgi:hypothetical protein
MPAAGKMKNLLCKVRVEKATSKQLKKSDSSQLHQTKLRIKTANV